ncbi:uncharacterized protein ACN427_001818 [Glossina fuscipes fuscipes]
MKEQVDYAGEYETEEEQEEEEEEQGTEKMQLNPSTDFYEDEDLLDDDENDDEDDDDDDDDDNEYDEDDEYDANEAESLPEARGLKQPSNNEDITDKEEHDNNEEEEEVDMGYDEDDERLAVERPKVSSSRQYGSSSSMQDFMNEEGSGNDYLRSNYNRFKSNGKDKTRMDYITKYRRKHQKFITDRTRGGETEVDLRESSGNFANDDEDNDDDSDDDDEDSEGFFSSKRKSHSRYFRKNTNDAIKIISTPLGKVSIVYQPTPNQADEKSAESSDKKSTTFTDFDALSPDPESSHRLASSHPKITPVLTPDGKVALLYRGDSENTKYEPIRNLTTHKFNNKPESKSSSPTDNLDNSDSDDSASSVDIDDDELSAGFKLDNDNKNAFGLKTTTDAEGQAEILPAPEVAPTTGSFIIRPTDSVLPMINRPLSEVLGIKKNQFKQFRIKDSQAVITTETEERALGSLDHSDSTTLHFMTKVNLADYPTSARTRNFDFDFSRDNTMLDERSRHKQEQQIKDMLSGHTSSNNYANSQHKVEDIANEEILSKTEVVNLAIIPHFDEELERLQRLREYEGRRHHRQRHRHKQTEEDLSGIHCVMQVMMGIAAISTVFGMLGTFFKQRILDQIRLMHW